VKAAVLAAGLGTRMKPLTDICPKPLLPVLNRPLLGLVLAQLEAAGCFQVAVNTHHLADQVQDFLRAEPWSFLLSVSHEPEILGTGGGLRQLGNVLREGPFLAINADILTDLDLAEIYRGRRPEAVSTLVLHDCPAYNNVWVKDGAVVSIGAPPPGGGDREKPLAYTGVQVVERKMMDYLPAPGQPYNLVQAWREAIAARERLACITVQGHFWQDLGTPANYLAAHRRLLAGASPRLARYFPGLADPLMGPGARIGAGAQFGGGVCLGAGVVVGEGAALKNTVVWDRAAISPDVELEDCIVASGVQVKDSARGRILIP
jgi:mannose-1-phosphate guanylyltransferase